MYLLHDTKLKYKSVLSTGKYTAICGLTFECLEGPQWEIQTEGRIVSAAALLLSQPINDEVASAF